MARAQLDGVLEICGEAPEIECEGRNFDIGNVVGALSVFGGVTHFKNVPMTELWWVRR